MFLIIERQSPNLITVSFCYPLHVTHLSDLQQKIFFPFVCLEQLVALGLYENLQVVIFVLCPFDAKEQHLVWLKGTKIFAYCAM